MIVTEDHWLDAATRMPTPNFTPGAAVKGPMYILFYRFGGSDLDVFLGRDPCQKRSMHLLVDRAGFIHQLCPFTAKAWHAGQSYWQGHHGLNSYAIGIALRTELAQDGYGDMQLAALDKIVPALVLAYNIRDVMCHGQVSASQAYDPGSSFPLERYKPYVEYGNAESAGKYIVAVPDEQTLNVRGGPDVQYSVIDKLESGDTVKVLRSAKDWVFISYQRKGEAKYWQGWVHESFVRRS